MKTRELEYDLPPELIAQHPVALRDESRLLVYPRVSQRVHERRFAELPDVIGDALVVVNDTRVVPARIPIDAPKGEVLLLEHLDDASRAVIRSIAASANSAQVLVLLLCRPRPDVHSVLAASSYFES